MSFLLELKKNLVLLPSNNKEIEGKIYTTFKVNKEVLGSLWMTGWEYKLSKAIIVEEFPYVEPFLK